MSGKRFFYVAAGLFLLMAAYTLGANRVQGQGTTSRIVATTYVTQEYALVAVAENGDWYYHGTGTEQWASQPWYRGGNIFADTGSIATQPGSWTGAKSTYRK